MRGDHDLSRIDVIEGVLRGLLDAASRQAIPDDRIVHEFAEDGQRSCHSELLVEPAM